MTVDPHQAPGTDVAACGRACRTEALAGVEAGDWRTVYVSTKSWVGRGGGAWLPDTWILYGAAGLLQGKPRQAIHSLDLGLRFWLAGPADQAALAWLRGVIVMDRLQDPKTALSDLRPASETLPSWLSGEAPVRLAACEAAAAASRKRVPSVAPRPGHEGPASTAHTVAPPVVDRSDGDVPEVWSAVAALYGY